MAMEKTLGYMIKFERERNGLTQLQLSQKSGISQQIISKLENTNAQSSRYANRIAMALNVNVEYLLSGKESQQKQNLDQIDKIPLVRIPLLNYDQARDFRAVLENNNDLEYIAVPMDELYSMWNFALEIKDEANSIAKNPQDLTLKRGCRIIINPEISPLPNELVVAKTDDSIVIGQLKQRSNGFSVVPTNDGYAPHDYGTGQEDKVLGTVVHIVQKAIKR